MDDGRTRKMEMEEKKKKNERQLRVAQLKVKERQRGNAVETAGENSTERPVAFKRWEKDHPTGLAVGGRRVPGSTQRGRGMMIR